MATVDRVDCVIDRPVYHRKAQRRDWRRLSRSHHNRVRCDQIPISHGVRTRDRGRRERDERWCNKK